MKFSTVALIALVSGYASAAPIEGLAANEVSAALTSREDDGFLSLPASAILNSFPIPDDIVPFVVEVNGTKVVLLINTTEADVAYEQNSTVEKREADAEAKSWDWIHFRFFEPMSKRSAEAKSWDWIHFRFFEPMSKRSAEADAEAKSWDWIHFRFFEPMSKRSAEAKSWDWIHFRFFEPMS